MLTLDYVAWFDHIATKKMFHCTIRGVYFYMFCKASENFNDYLEISQSEIAHDLGISVATVSKSLTILQGYRLIKKIATGIYGFLAPHQDWLRKRRENAVKIVENPLISRTREAAKSGNLTTTSSKLQPETENAIAEAAFDSPRRMPLDSPYKGKSVAELLALKIGSK